MFHIKCGHILVDISMSITPFVVVDFEQFLQPKPWTSMHRNCKHKIQYFKFPMDLTIIWTKETIIAIIKHCKLPIYCILLMFSTWRIWKKHWLIDPFKGWSSRKNTMLPSQQQIQNIKKLTAQLFLIWYYHIFALKSFCFEP